MFFGLNGVLHGLNLRIILRRSPSDRVTSWESQCKPRPDSHRVALITLIKAELHE